MNKQTYNCRSGGGGGHSSPDLGLSLQAQGALTTPTTSSCPQAGLLSRQEGVGSQGSRGGTRLGSLGPRRSRLTALGR